MTNDPTVDNNLLDDYKVETIQQADGSHRQVMATTSIVIPSSHDTEEITYVASGNGEGKIETVTYKKDGDTIAVQTLSYNADNKVSLIVWS